MLFKLSQHLSLPVFCALWGFAVARGCLCSFWMWYNCLSCACCICCPTLVCKARLINNLPFAGFSTCIQALRNPLLCICVWQCWKWAGYAWFNSRYVVKTLPFKGTKLRFPRLIVSFSTSVVEDFELRLSVLYFYSCPLCCWLSWILSSILVNYVCSSCFHLCNWCLPCNSFSLCRNFGQMLQECLWAGHSVQLWQGSTDSWKYTSILPCISKSLCASIFYR